MHNANVVGSYNALRLAVECGIRRVCQASSANAIGLAYSRSSRYDYFPIDEQHPSYTEDPYSLSKWICEQQADSIARRYAEVSIASLRFHWVTTERDVARREYLAAPDAGRSHLFGYTLLSAAATACLRSVAADLGGHEVMFIVAPDTASDTPTLELARRFHPEAKIRADLTGHRSFFDSSKADRLIGPTHRSASRWIVRSIGGALDLGAARGCGGAWRARVAVHRHAVAARPRSASAAARPGTARRCRRHRRARWRFRSVMPPRWEARPWVR